MTASPPNAVTTRAMRSSSVATSTRLTLRAWHAREKTCSIIGRPAISASGLPGNRDDS